MPTVPVDDSGSVLYYEDSGAPEGSTSYLTVVLVHGLLFHGGEGGFYVVDSGRVALIQVCCRILLMLVL